MKHTLDGTLSSIWKQVVLGTTLVAVGGLSGCSNLPSAKYRSWSQADEYFHQHNRTISKAKNHALADGNCRFGTYRVQRGESVLRIAKKCGVHSIALINANALLPPFHLQVGQTLIIPKSLYEAERHFQRKQQPPQVLWRVPIAKQKDSRILDNLLKVKDKRLFIPVAKSTSLYPVAPGKVVYIGRALEDYGLMAIVKHPDGYLSIYTHMKASFILKGQQVHTTTQLGLIAPPVKPELTPYVEARYLGRKVAIYPLLSGKMSANTTSRSSVVNTL